MSATIQYRLTPAVDALLGERGYIHAGHPDLWAAKEEEADVVQPTENA